MRILQLTFSPTGGTERAAGLITSEWGGPVERVDLTDPAADLSACRVGPGDLVLIAMPSYGGRVPALAAERLARVRGNAARCVLLCVYGNRAYEDTLVEMEDLAKASGFTVIAAVAAVAEHSILHQYAAGRPDTEDAARLRSFAGQILERVTAGATGERPKIPGNRPYKNRSGGGKMVPKAGAACNGCGRCAESCPAGAISKGELRGADPQKCISCMRCVVNCPQGARGVNAAVLSAAALALKKACSQRKEAELFL